jgi:hypothetical protein
MARAGSTSARRWMSASRASGAVAPADAIADPRKPTSCHRGDTRISSISVSCWPAKPMRCRSTRCPRSARSRLQVAALPRTDDLLLGVATDATRCCRSSRCAGCWDFPGVLLEGGERLVSRGSAITSWAGRRPDQRHPAGLARSHGHQRPACSIAVRARRGSTPSCAYPMAKAWCRCFPRRSCWPTNAWRAF